MSVAFIPKSLANEITNLPVLSIYAAAHPETAVTSPSGSTASPKTNHWVLYLAISKTESIRLDPSPGSDDKMTLIVTKKDYLLSANAVKSIQLYTVKNLTVGNIIDHLRSSKYDQYRFNAGGQGCRYWIYSVINLLRSAQYLVDESQVEEAKLALKFVWGKYGKVKDEEQVGIVAGTFV